MRQERRKVVSLVFAGVEEDDMLFLSLPEIFARAYAQMWLAALQPRPPSRPDADNRDEDRIR
jgi:hypothetical protein